MSVFLIIVIAVFLDRLIGEPESYHPLRGFTRMAAYIEQISHGNEDLIPNKSAAANQVAPSLVKIKGFFAMLVVVLPCLALVSWLCRFFLFGSVFEIVFLYVSISAHNLKLHATDVDAALAANNTDKARSEISHMVSRATLGMGAHDILIACLQSVLKDASNAIVAPIFWYFFLGAPGAVLYRLIHTLAFVWDEKHHHYKNFGWAASRLNDLLSWIPDRLTAIGYIIVGNVKSLHQNFLQLSRILSPNIAITTGSIALGIDLSMPPKGGKPAQLSDIAKACHLVDRSIILWLAVVLLLITIRNI